MSTRARVEALEGAIESPSEKTCTIVVWGDDKPLPKCPKSGNELTRDQDGKPSECSGCCRVSEKNRKHIFVKWV